MIPIPVSAGAREGEEKEDEKLKEEEMVSSGGYSSGLSRPTNSDSKAFFLFRKILEKDSILKDN